MKKTSKKLIAWLITVCMVMSMVPTVAFATDNVTITADTSAIVDALEAGDTFTVPVVVSNNTGFTNFDLGVDYDDSVLTLTGISAYNESWNELLAGYMTFEESATTGLFSATTVNAKYTAMYSTDYVSTNGDLVWLSFTVNEGAYNGPTTISIEPSSAATKGTQGVMNDTTALAVSFVSGTVTISGGDEVPEPVEVYDTDGTSWGDGYDTITDALAAMLTANVHDEGYTVKLHAHVSDTVVILSTASTPFDITIDLNGYTLTKSGTAGAALSITDDTANADTVLTVTSGQDGGTVDNGSTSLVTSAISDSSTTFDTNVTLDNITVEGAVSGPIQLIENCKITGYVQYQNGSDNWKDGTIPGLLKNSIVGTGGNSVGMYLKSGYITIENSEVYGNGSYGVNFSSPTTDVGLTITGDDTIIANTHASNGSAISGSSTSIKITLSIEGGTIYSDAIYGRAMNLGTGVTTTITGGTFTGENGSISLTNGTLNISGDAKIVCDGTYSISVDGGTLNVSGGDISSDTSVAIIANDGTVNVSGGTLTGSNYGAMEQTGGILNISDDAILIGDGTYGIGVYGGTLNVSGGDISSNASVAIGAWGGDVNISGGTMTAGAYSAMEINNTASAVTVTGGTINGGSVDGIGLYSAESLAISGGTITSTGNRGVYSGYNIPITIEGGTITGNSYAVYLTTGSATYGGESVVGPTINGSLYGSSKHTATSGAFTSTTNLTIADGSYLTSSVNDEGYYQVIVGESPYISIVFSMGTFETEYTLEKGDTFADLTAPTVVPADGYTFDGWYVGDVEMTDAYTFTADTTITAKFVETISGGTTAVDYIVTTTLDDTAYRSGETINATVTVKAEEGVDIGSFDMDLSYDSTYVTLGTVSAGSSFANITASGNQVFYNYNESAVDVGTEGTVMFTVTFTANANVSADDTVIGVTDVKITPDGVDSNRTAPTVVNATADIIDTVDISLSADTNGTYGGTATITVDKNSTLVSLTTATGYSAPVAADNYTFTGWYLTDGTLLDDTDIFADDTTITAKFAAGSFALTVNAGDATVTKSGESTAYIENAVNAAAVTYGTDFSFTVAANAGYIVNTVSYQVDDETAVTMTATDGVYKIDGDAITDDITILVSTTAYYAITFSSGDNASFGTDDSNVVYYAKAGSTGLYTNATCTTAVTALPTATASTGYRLADSSWGTSESDILDTITHTAATTYTSSVVKTYTITFAAADSNGTVATTYDGIYDTGATVTVPEVTANTGYVFNGWTTTGTALASDAETLTASEDVTYTATFTEGTYAVTFPTVTGITFTDKDGLTTDDKATYNQMDDVTFGISTSGVQVTAVSYTVSGGSAVTITAENGVYTIPSSAITNAVSITVTASNVYTVAFTTTSSNGTVGGTTSFNVTSGSTLGDMSAVTVTPAAGYQFDGWYIDTTEYANPENETVSANVTYTAQFSLIQYTITADTGSITFVSGYGDYATYGTDVTFTVTGDSGIVTGVSLGETALTVNANGVYTIPYTSFGTTAALEVTVTTLDASIDFIAIGTTNDGDYMADVTDFSGQKIMVLTVTNADGTTNYAVGDTSMFWSSEYSAYVRLVDDSATVQSVSATISSNENAVTSIDYSGDINGDGEVRSDDAGIINSILHGTRLVTTSELYLFMSDVNGNKGLSTSDITAIMKTYFGT